MGTIMRINVDKARFDPAAVFPRPMDIVAEPGLTRGQKLATLKRWSECLHDQLPAASEGMQTPLRQSVELTSTLDEIALAQSRLRDAESGETGLM
jgi:hypothetical protein